jgi:hypothetical protein
MRRTLVAVAIVVGGVAAILAGQARPQESAMAHAAKAFMATLDPPQLQNVRLPFDSEERFNWHFIPRERKGLPLKEMTERQQSAAIALLKSGLSEKGYAKAETIRSLENVLRAIEGRDIRDPGLYFFTIFGDPDKPSWGWRYEGHHISQNWTVVNGKAIATTPAFFGANPAEVRDGPMKGTRALPAEEDLALALFASLDEGERKQALVDEKAPNDILTSNARKAAILDNVGLEGRAMTSAQQSMLMKLIEEHASAQQASLAGGRLAKVHTDGLGTVRFAWMGATKKAPGAGYYYRIQGKSFLIEYDNTQNEANHQHVVWRDFAGDFGTDLLAEHYAYYPHSAGGSASAAANR